jgi:hypothetical protein
VTGLGVVGLTVAAEEIQWPSSRKHQFPGHSPPAAPSRGPVARPGRCLSLAAIAGALVKDPLGTARIAPPARPPPQAVGGSGVHGSAVPSLVTGPSRSPGCGLSWRCRAGSRTSPPLARRHRLAAPGPAGRRLNAMQSEAFMMSPLPRPGRRRAGPATSIAHHQRPPDARHCERHQNGDDGGQASEDHGLLPSVAPRVAVRR